MTRHCRTHLGGSDRGVCWAARRWDRSTVPGWPFFHYAQVILECLLVTRSQEDHTLGVTRKTTLHTHLGVDRSIRSLIPLGVDLGFGLTNPRDVDLGFGLTIRLGATKL